MESLDAGVLSGEEGLGVREFELPLSVDMLTASGVEVEGSVEADLAGVEGIFATRHGDHVTTGGGVIGSA